MVALWNSIFSSCGFFFFLSCRLSVSTIMVPKINCQMKKLPCKPPAPAEHFVMAALCNTAGQYIFALWFLSSIFFFFFFLASSQRPQIGSLPYFHTWCGPSANLECTSEMCCKRLTGNTGRKKLPFWHHRTTLSGYIFATKACIDNRKKTC